MHPDRSALRTYFAKLGLPHEIADLYLALYIHGPQTISSLSRTANIERTRIYRLIDMLLESSLVEIETHNRRAVIKAAPISQLHILINKREQELKNLTDELGLLEQVMARNSLSNEAFSVRLYSAPPAILHLLEELLTSSADSQTPKDISIYGVNNLAAQVGEKLIAKWLTKLRTSEFAVHTSPTSSDTTWLVCGDTVLYIQQTSTEVSALALRSTMIAHTHRQLFAFLTRS